MEHINRKALDVFRQNREIISLYFVVLAIVILGMVFFPAFRGRQNLINLMNQIVPIGFVALGQTYVILTTGIDLSVGSVMSLTTVLAATRMNGGDFQSVIITLLLVFAAAIVVGGFNGLMIARLRLEPLIVTLATGSIVGGIALFLLPHPGGYVPYPFTQLWSQTVFNFVPMGFLYLLIIIALSYFLLRNTRFGRWVYATGGNERKARNTGLKVDLVKVKVYITCSLFASFSGLALASRMHSGDPLSGNPFTLFSVAAVLVGGTTFSGGRGGILNTVAGIFILSLLRIFLNIAGVSPYFQNLLTGLIIIAAVLYSSYSKGSLKGGVS